jgi:hypothetical protein
MCAKKIVEEDLRRKEKTLSLREKEIQQREKELTEFQASLQNIHELQCPACGHKLQLIAAENLEVHACEECRGAWIDRASMEVLIKYTIDRRKNFFTKVFGLT